MKNFNKRRFALRIVALPFVLGIMAVSHIFCLLRQTRNFLLYGGEYINFEQNERESMLKIFEMLKEIRKNQEEKL
jgi:quinol-cytochrome oxidoreductase complex cytochrome b subunit